MNWTTARMDLDNDQAKTRNTDLNSLFEEVSLHINQLNGLQI